MRHPCCFPLHRPAPASFGANNGAYRCGAPAFKYTGNLPQPTTLADVGQSLSNLK